MKVLLLTQVLPYPPVSGPAVKTWHVLRYLSGGHEITLASFERDESRDALRHLGSCCSEVHTVPMRRELRREVRALGESLGRRLPWVIARDERRAMRDLVRRLAARESFDVVHADQLNMCPYAEAAGGAFRLLDTHNALWVLYRRLAATLAPGPKRLLLEREWRLLKRYEGSRCRSFDAVTAVSEKDRAALVEASGRTDVDVVPIAIDTAEVAPFPRPGDPDRVTYVGTMHWPPNADAATWFTRTVWPRIRVRRPSAHLQIVGAHPPRSVRHLAATAGGVTVTGFVADLDAELARTTVLVVPLRAGGGMRVRILQALARGIPVVSTRLGAEGIRVTDEHDILIADDPEELAAAVLRLLLDPALAARLGRNGRRLAEAAYDYRVACRPLDEIYARAARRRSERGGPERGRR